MPPVMGAGAFIMAEWLGISYLTVIKAALIPGLMYFISVAFFVHLRAVKTGIKGASREDLPSFKDTLIEGLHFLIPIGVLIFLLLKNFSPTYCAGIALVVLLIVSWLRPRTRIGLIDILKALRNAAITALPISAACAVAGIIVGVVGLTGIGLKFSAMVISVTGGNLLLALFLICLASLVLGMGLPVTASYITLAVLAGPALKELGLPLLVGHLIIFWFSQDSSVTPPVALVAYAASGIAKSNPLETAFNSWKLAKGLYIIPLLMAYTDLASGDYLAASRIAIPATLGMFCITCFLESYFLKPIRSWERPLLLLAGVGLLLPKLTWDLIGVASFCVVVLSQKFIRNDGRNKRALLSLSNKIKKSQGGAE